MKEKKRIIACSLNGKPCSSENPDCKYTGTGYGCLYQQVAREVEIGEVTIPPRITIPSPNNPA
jgi:hypothetical protein